MTPRTPRRWLAALILAAASPACIQIIPLEPNRAAPPAAAGTPALEVIATLAGGADPLPVRNARLVYSGVIEATQRYVAAAAAPWAARHAHARPGGWQMTVEIVRSGAEAGAGALTVELETRVTLRGTVGHLHLGQTNGYCKVSDPLAGDGAPVVYDCLERMGRDLAGWLEGIEP
jgi:hypothetical protein